MKRYKHNLSHSHLTSFDQGFLIPVGCVEVLPGDSFNHSTSALVRLTPQLKPVMNKVHVQIHHFYVPNRILWSGWRDFITGKSSNSPPFTNESVASGTLPDYLGVVNSDNKNDFSLLPIRAYNKIYNEYYCDQDLISEASEDSFKIQRVAWQKDYFTTARPWAQKGGDVTIPLGDKAPVVFKNQGYVSGSDSESISISKREVEGLIASNWPTSVTKDVRVSISSRVTGQDAYANLAGAKAVDIKDLKEAFALQKYREAAAKYGSDYVDYLRYLGITPSDARLQRPEYLAGGRQTVSFSEVINTGDDLGKLGGHGIAALRSNRYRKFFEEHGFLMTMMMVRPEAIYVNGLHKKFTRKTKEDYFQRELENIGAEEIFNREVYAGHSNPNGIFGYGSRYSSYASEPSRVSSEFKQSVSSDWHQGRIFEADIALNQTFIECNPSKRIFAERNHDSLQVMVKHSLIARRQVKPLSAGGL